MKTSRIILYGTLSLGLIVALWLPSQGSEHTAKAASRKSTRTKTNSDAAWDLLPALDPVPFERPSQPLRNIFKPLLYVDITTLKEDAEPIMKIPAPMADGDGNWAYTGMAEINGVRMALLENSAKHEAGYVKEGETWKKSRIAQISQASIIVVGPDGSEETVFRYNANLQPKPKAAPAGDAGFRPMDLGASPLRGQIGPNIEITPTGPQTVQATEKQQ